MNSNATINMFSVEISKRHQKLKEDIAKMDISPSVKKFLERSIDYVYYGGKKVYALGEIISACHNSGRFTIYKFEGV